MIAQGDKNGDSKLDAAEMTAVAEAWFDKMDSEKTGKIAIVRLPRAVRDADAAGTAPRCDARRPRPRRRRAVPAAIRRWPPGPTSTG